MRRADDENDESITRKSMCCCCSKDFPTSPTPVQYASIFPFKCKRICFAEVAAAQGNLAAERERAREENPLHKS